MRRLALLCLLVTAVCGYNLVLQELTLTGGRITSNELNCDNMETLHIGGYSYNFECYDVLAPDDKTKLESRKLVYKAGPITTKAKSLYCEIVLKDQSKATFNFAPQMKVGQLYEGSVGTVQYNPITTPAAPTTPASTTPAPTTALDCSLLASFRNPACDAYCKDPDNAKTPGCTGVDPNGKASARVKAVKKLVSKPQPEQPAASIEQTIPVAIRVRGPGPVRLPARFHPAEEVLDTVVVSDEDEERLRVKREDNPPPPVVDSTTLSVSVLYYILDEAGNPAAVWAAVIEGIILLLLVGACFYFFFWAPRARQVAAAASDPYKDDGPSYSVSYANSSYNNQRIDAFQPPSSTATPAAPPRPANSTYMDDYITDNIGAMSRPGATTTQPASAAANSSAFQPGHQRFDSSGLVTVNLS